MATVNNNTQRYVIDATSKDWREATNDEERKSGVTAEGRRYNDGGDTWVAAADGQVSAENRRYHDGGDSWVAAKDGEVTEDDRRYVVNEGDERLVADVGGQFDSDGRLASYRRKEKNAEGQDVWITGKLSSYTPDNDGLDGYEPGNLQYGKARNYFDFTMMDGENRVISWDTRASNVAQRFLDLMNDSSGAVTPEMKSTLIKQASISFLETTGPENYNDDAVNMNQSFQFMVEFYLKHGTVWLQAEFKKKSLGEMLRDGPTMIHPGLTPGKESNATRQAFRKALNDMIDVINKVTEKIQPPTPGKREADALLKVLGSGALMADAKDRFSSKDMLF